MKKSIFLLLIHLNLPVCACAQVSFSIKPTGNWIRNIFEPSQGNVLLGNVEKKGIINRGGFGIKTEVDFLKNDWGIYFGYLRTTIGFRTHKLPFDESHLVYSKGSSVSDGISNSLLNQVHLGATKTIKSFSFFPVHAQSRLVRAYRYITKNEQPFDGRTYYLTQFKVKLTGGMGLGFLEKIQSEERTREIPLVSVNAAFPPGSYPVRREQVGTISRTWHVPIYENPLSMSLFAGFSFQFFGREKDGLEIFAYYSQGLGNIITQEFSYYFKNASNQSTPSYQKTFYSKGSMMVFGLAFPIVFQKFMGKDQIVSDK